MAEKVLSQEEVDALMSGVSSGDIDTESDKPEEVEGVKTYDLINQDRIVLGRMPVMEVINERFVKYFRESVRGLISREVEITIDGPKMVKYGELLKKTPLPASFNILQLSPLRGTGLLILDANLIFTVVDNYFGGNGKFHTKIEGREFTNLEMRIINKLVTLILNGMKESWKEVLAVNFNCERSELSPHFINAISSTDLLIISSFAVEIDTNKCKFSLCIPFSSVEPIKEKLYGGYQARADDDGSWVRRLEERVKGASLQVSGEIGRADITIEEFLRLGEGDIIQLNTKPSDPVKLNIEGVTKFVGIPGIYRGQYAIQVIGTIKKEGE